MGVVAFPFATMGFIFGILAYSQASANAAKITELEQRLADAGLAPEDN